MSGRLVGELRPRTRRVVYGDLSGAEIGTELPPSIRVDRAHVVMLAEQQLIPRDTAGELLRCMAELEADDYRPLLGRPAPRGLYLMYEGYLIERLGPGVGGVLHSGRSRNDLKACVTALRFTDWALDFAEQAIRLQGVLLARSRAHESVVMPVHTHFQAAMPVTFGYYLLGVALAIGRDVEALRTAADGLRRCPLGAGAVAGTDLAIDTGRTAQLLGFDGACGHALDAVASRDVPLRLLAAAAGLTATVSRLATDLQLWSTAEFGFVEFPDRLVGGSSAMPQKRNAFLLEHLKAKPGHVFGALAAAGSMAATAPFTNSIEVGTEAVAAVWPGLVAAEQSVLLAQVVVGGARPVPDRMADRVRTGFTAATSIANRLVHAGVPFRTAHTLVGDAVRRAVEAGSTDLLAHLDPPPDVDLSGLDPASLVRAHRYGGGPGAQTAARDEALWAWCENRNWLSAWNRQRTAAAARLDAAVRGLA